MKKILFVAMILAAGFVAFGQAKATFPAGGTELKIEVESMDLVDMPVIDDAKASGGKAVTLASKKSTAKILVTLPAGTYEGLVNEWAPSPESDAFYVVVDGTYYRNFPSDPPVGGWELTTRTPMTIVVKAAKAVEFIIKSDSPTRAGETGMKLDYIVLKKK